MSRSLKKHPVLKAITKGSKHLANKKVRRQREQIPSGNSYRKVFNSYDIVDQYSRISEQEYLVFWTDRFTKEEWKKWYLKK